MKISEKELIEEKIEALNWYNKYKKVFLFKNNNSIFIILNNSKRIKTKDNLTFN